MANNGSVTGGVAAGKLIASGTFTAADTSVDIPLIPGKPDFNVFIDFAASTTGSVRLNRKLPGQSAFAPVTYSDGSAVGPFTADHNGAWEETERGTTIQVECTALSGTSIDWRISQ